MAKCKKQATAWILLLAVVFGLLSSVPVTRSSAANVETEAKAEEVVNLLADRNPNFESYSVPGWRITEGVVQCDEHPYNDNGWSLKLNDSSAAKRTSAISEPGAINAGENYLLSAQVYGGVGELTLTFYDQLDRELTDDAIVLTTAAASEKWEELSAEFTAPAKAAHYIVMVSTTLEGTEPVWFDAVTVAGKKVAAAEPELSNGSFDAPWEGNVIPGWTVKNSPKLERVAQGDGYALALTKAQGSGYSILSDFVAVQEGNVYNFSVDIKLATASSCQVYINFYDANNTKLKDAKTILIGDFTAKWQTVVVNGAAPVGAVSAQILITDPVYNAGVAYFDNAAIYLANEPNNPSFEGPKNNVGNPIGIAGSGGCLVNNDMAYVHSGTQSVATNNTFFVKTDLINVKPGETYEATIRIKREAGNNETMLACFYMYFYDGNGNKLQEPWNKANPVSNAWTDILVSYTAPEEAAYVQLMFYRTGNGGKCYFDDLTFRRTTENNLLKNELTNGSFDSRNVVNNTPVQSWHASSSSDANSFAMDYMGTQQGYAARVYNSTYMQTWTDPIAVTVGETYSFTINARGEGRLQAYIRFYASESDDRGSYMCDEAGKDLSKYAVTPNLREDQWTQLAVASVVVPEGATCVRILLCALTDSNSGNIHFNFDDACLFNGVPELVIPGENGAVWNGGFENINEKTGMADYWGTWGNNVLSLVDASKNPDDVYEGRYSLKITVPADLSGTHGTQCDPFPITAGVTYRLSGYAKEDYQVGRGFQLHLQFYNKSATMVMGVHIDTPGTGEWNYCDITATAPSDAVYARVVIVSGAGKGSVCFYQITLSADADAGLSPEMFDGVWSVANEKHPRVLFDNEGLEKMQRFGKSKSVCAYGYAGNVTQKALLAQADTYLNQTSMSIVHLDQTREYPLYPVLEDPTYREDFAESPTGYNVGYPYMTAVGQRLKAVVEVLTLAYSLTGEEKYAERAMQYALDICDWKLWYGYLQHIASGGDEKSMQVTGDLSDAVVMVYDICYDLLTVAERQKIYDTLMERCLEAMYHDCWARMIRNRDMDHATCMITAACALLTEDNVDVMKKYLDMGMTYINWRLNFFMNSGVNEGHMYDSLAIDDIVLTMAALERTTGYAGPWDHPYMQQLEKRVLGFFDPVNGELPAYSDSDFECYYPYSMAVFSQRGNELATYYLANSSALSSYYDKMLFFTEESIADLEMPDERIGNVTFVDSHGFGSLRTGWGVLDSLLVINTNGSEQEHNHYDQNSIMLTFNGIWVLTDSEYKDNSYSDLTTWQMKYTNSTIFVDGKPQVRKGQGTLSQVFDTHIYGYFMGSAPDAYGMEDKQAVLNQFDRHVIMLNHDSQPYYIIIDDLDSNKERNFGWNFYTNGWDRIEMDGENVAKGESATGQRLTLSRFGCTLHSYFVGNQVTSKEVSYSEYGPTLLLEGEKARNYQFMNVLSVQKGSGSQISTLFEHLMTAQSSTEPEYMAEGEISWSTRRSDTTKNSILSVSIGSPLVMFRAGLPGDWISFPFKVDVSKEYSVSVEVGRGGGYTGVWNIYIDDKLVEIYEAHGSEAVVTIDAGKMDLEAGLHTVKVILAATPETQFTGTIMSVGGITLDTGESMGEGVVKVTEQYNEGDLLGATVTYGPVLKDVVVFNRGTGEISGGGLTTNGQQASIIGINGSEIAEGYAVTRGTSLKYGSQLLMTAEGPVSIAMDYTMAKFPVKNDTTEDEVAVHEDFDIENPVYYVSAQAEAATKVSLNVGIHAPYTVMIGEQVIESTHSGEMLTFTLPAGASQITIKGTHQHVFDQHATNILNIKDWAGCGHNNTYYVSCVCGQNGTETFTDGDIKGHTLKAVKAVEPTDSYDGNIAHYKCTKCGKLFADKDGTKELSMVDVRILSIAKQNQQILIVIIAIIATVVILGGGAIALVVILKKRKTRETPGE